jgi:hypothetical protein
MYHINKINQVSIKENLSTPRFSYKHLHIDHYQSSCTPSQLKILNYIRTYQYCPWIKLSNERIANYVGCSVVTVIRATNKFHKDGFIIKHQENKYTSNTYSLCIVVDQRNKRIFQSEYDRPNKNSLILNNLFINRNPSSRKREGGLRIFKKIIDHKKGKIMNDYRDPSLFIVKSKEKTPQKRNTGGHSPAVVKPTLSIEQQIHAKKVDIAFFRIQIEKPEEFWDSRNILFSVNVKMAQSLLSKAIEELKELEAKKNGTGDRNEKQEVLYQHSANIVAACSA